MNSVVRPTLAPRVAGALQHAVLLRRPGTVRKSEVVRSRTSGASRGSHNYLIHRDISRFRQSQTHNPTHNRSGRFRTPDVGTVHRFTPRVVTAAERSPQHESGRIR